MADSYLKSLLGQNEQVIFTTRQHWLILVGEILSESVLTIALFVLVSLIWWNGWLPTLVVLAGYLLLLFPLASMLRDVQIWTNRKYVVTNRRVIQIAGVINKDVTDSSLEKVNDVKLEQSVLGRVFDYGDIEILTASELGINRFRRVGYPIRFKTAMLNAKVKVEQMPAPAPRPESDLVSMLEQLDSLRRQGVLTETEFQTKKAEVLARF
jgi:uncharacterized membrane protein YdbT with pleckstrin-like domain